MKLLFITGTIALVALSLVDAKPYSDRGCIYVMGRCYRECEVGTHAYTTGCGYLTPEATCTEPNPKEDRNGMICDYSACYCDPPTVRDESTKKCVPLEQCPKKQ